VLKVADKFVTLPPSPYDFFDEGLRFFGVLISLVYGGGLVLVFLDGTRCFVALHNLNYP
jgi:hypothetical protein